MSNTTITSSANGNLVDILKTGGTGYALNVTGGNINFSGAGKLFTVEPNSMLNGSTQIAGTNFYSGLIANPFSAAYNVTNNKTITFNVGFSAVAQTIVRIYFGGSLSNDGGNQNINYKDFYLGWDANVMVLSLSDAVVSKAAGTNYHSSNLSFGTITKSGTTITIPLTIISTYNGAGGTVDYFFNVQSHGISSVVSDVSFN